MRDWWDDIWPVIVALCFVVAACVVGLFCFQRARIALEPVVRITVDGRVIYTGSAACTSVKSAGATTQVNIGRGLLCLLPGQQIVSRDVLVETLP